MNRLRVAVFGAGYWAQFQIAAWQALGVEVAVIWNRTRAKAEATAARFGISRVFDTPEAVFDFGGFDIADIITEVDGHKPLTLLAAARGKDVICQKPMAYTLRDCEEMAGACRRAGVWYAVHENFRYQPPLAAAAEAMRSGEIGRPLTGHLQLRSPDRALMASQPALASMDHMALRDMGPHIFDVARVLFGDWESVYSRPVRSYPEIPVDDAARSIVTFESGLTISCDLVHRFDYKLFVEGERGVLRLGADNALMLETDRGRRFVPVHELPRLPYIPENDWLLHGWHVFSAIPACLADLVAAYRSGCPAPTSGMDNLKTMRLVFAAMRSQDERRAVRADEM